MSASWETHDKDAFSLWHALHFIFAAVLVPIMCLLHDAASQRVVSWQDQVQRAINLCLRIATFWIALATLRMGSLPLYGRRVSRWFRCGYSPSSAPTPFYFNISCTGNDH
ncbi:hypothetical protein BDV12DRAFT_181396 [Aspergillus spectabilis]